MQLEENASPGSEQNPGEESDVLIDDAAAAAAAALKADGSDESANETVETDEQKNTRLAEEARQKAVERAARRQSSINARFAEITAEKKAAVEMADKLLEIVQQRERPASNTNAAPVRENFPSYEEFIDAKTAWTTQRIVHSALAQAEERRVASQTAETKARDAAQVSRAYAQRHAEAAKSIPDFEETMANADVQVPNSVARLIQVMPDGPKIAYHLVKNPALASRFSSAAPEMHGVILGEISAALKSTAKPSSASPPGKPAKTASTGTTSENPPEDTDAYMKWADKHLKKE